MKMKLKNNSKRIKKTFIYIIFIYTIFTITFYYSMKENSNDNNSKFINLLLEGASSDILTKDYFINAIDNSTNYLFKISFKSPDTILDKSITVFNEKEYQDDYSNLEELKKISSYIEDPNPTSLENPLVYIYNSHQLENYDNTNLDIYGITPNVMMASYLLKEKLNRKGIPTIVEDTNLTSFLSLNGWDHSYSYRASRIFILDKKNEYPSLKYFIDIHRDSVGKSDTTFSINNKSYARILFVIGLEYDSYKENLSNTEKLNNLVDKYYPGLSKGIYKKEGPGVDGIYNQDISPNSMLIEVGGVDNNIDEVLNTIDALSEVLYFYIKGE